MLRFHRALAKPAARLAVAKWLVLLIVLGLVIWARRPIWQPAKGMSKQGAQLAGQSEVILYATDWCGYCAANGIRYSELDIEKSSTAFEEHRRLRGNGVPLVVVGDNLVHGYNEAELRAFLRHWLRKS